jgi:biofilm PGA synthesis lipoprotein PgaB
LDRVLRPALLVLILAVAGAFFCTESVRAAPPRPYFTDTGQFSYAEFLMGEGEFAEAAGEYERLIENFPSSPLLADAQFKGATAYLNAGRYREARAGFELFLMNFKDDPHSPEARAALVRARAVLGRVKPAPKARTPASAYKRPPIKAVQVALFGGLGYAGIDKEFARFKNAGIDTVIVRVFHNKGDRIYEVADRVEGGVPLTGVYFKTDSAPVVADVLARFIELAHGNGLEIFAWMTSRYADYGIEGRAEFACRGYDIKNRLANRCKGLDLFNPLVVKRLESIYSDLADYDIDGILFQDDLVLRHNEGFGPHAAALFKMELGGRTLDPESLYVRAETGRGIDYTPLFWRWASWKNRRLLKVAGRLRDVVRKKRPGVKFALNLMYESVTNSPSALAWLSQDLAMSVEADFDYYAIMAYHRQMGHELGKRPIVIKGLIEKMVVDAARTVGDPQRVLIKLQTIDWKTGRALPDTEVVELIRRVMATRNVSVAVVPYRGDFPFYELGMGPGYALNE